jgi:Family of unknown function (DUF6364)
MLALFWYCVVTVGNFQEMKIKTSLSLSQATLRKVKREAKRQRRSVSQLVEIWIESAPAVNGEKSPNRATEAVPV